MPSDHGRQLVLFLLLALGAFSRAGEVMSNCKGGERRALLAVKSDMYDTGGWLSSWTGDDCCEWRGVTCDGGGRVTGLDLRCPDGTENRTSKVNPSLLELKHLKRLDLSMNDFGGAPIPKLLADSLVHLEYLNLSNAGFGGLIPPHLGNLSGLRHLDLGGWSNNKLRAGELQWLSRIPSLEYLDMSCLDFTDSTGDIFAIVGNISRSLKHLNLGFNSLSGEIPPSVGDLLHLEFLDLQHNCINGAIPQSMSNLTNLVFLYMSENNISGRIPESLGNLLNLEGLYLSKNNISGEIPKTIGNLRSLQFLYLDSNQITGKIPETIGNIQNLKELSLDDNSITGQIPETIGQLYILEMLSLPKNYLAGQIPRNLGDLCNLSLLDLSYNDLVGGVTDVINSLSNCSGGSPLTWLYINSNNLSSIIPPSLGQLSEIEDLDISLNSLQGNITEAHFSNLTNLGSLDISFNSLNVILPNDWLPPFSASMIDMSYCRLETKFPDWIRTQESLGALHLSGVGLSGDIPRWFSDELLGGMSSLNLSSNYLMGPLPLVPTASPLLTLDLSNNSFQGPIPPSLTNAAGLQALILSRNNLSGNLPLIFCNLSKLEVVNLSDNELSGNVPSCRITSSTFLQSLHLDNNDLSGGFPSFLNHCKVLITLGLSENEFSGEIPTWIGTSLPSLKVLSLRSNRFHGTIPASLSNLSSLQVLDLSSNDLSGRIPSSLGCLSAMRVVQKENKPLYRFYSEIIVITAKGLSLQYTALLSLVTSIDLSNNDLSGEIPEELKNLIGLRFLSLSNNHLTGRIPDNISALGLLESLDLSMNNLSGAIPSSLSALNFLSHLNLSYNNLSGKIPTGNQLSTFNDPSVYAGNRNLCGAPLLDCLSDTELVKDDRSGDDKLETIFVIISIVLGFVVGFWLSFGMILVKHSMRIALFRSTDEIADLIYVQVAVKYSKLKSRLRRMML